MMNYNIKQNVEGHVKGELNGLNEQSSRAWEDGTYKYMIKLIIASNKATGSKASQDERRPILRFKCHKCP